MVKLDNRSNKADSINRTHTIANLHNHGQNSKSKTIKQMRWPQGLWPFYVGWPVFMKISIQYCYTCEPYRQHSTYMHSIHITEKPVGLCRGRKWFVLIFSTFLTENSDHCSPTEQRRRQSKHHSFQQSSNTFQIQS